MAPDVNASSENAGGSAYHRQKIWVKCCHLASDLMAGDKIQLDVQLEGDRTDDGALRQDFVA
jgi:hypothetical protein